MAANEKNRRKSPRRKIDPQVQQRLRDVAGELRQLMYGEQGCPEWGTLFREIEADGETYRAPHIVIATGGRPKLPDIPGEGLGITSDGFFELDAVPARVAVVGGGYVAVELAGVLKRLGSEVTLLDRQDRVIR